MRNLGPVVIFLVTILVVADVCARAGLFTAAAARVRSGESGGRPEFGFLTGIFLLAAAVTAALSLDATVVLLTPVMFATAVARRHVVPPARLRLPPAGQLRLAASAGLQPHQPARDAAPRPLLRRLRADHSRAGGRLASSTSSSAGSSAATAARAGATDHGGGGPAPAPGPAGRGRPDAGRLRCGVARRDRARLDLGHRRSRAGRLVAAPWPGHAWREGDDGRASGLRGLRALPGRGRRRALRGASSATGSPTCSRRGTTFTSTCC